MSTPTATTGSSRGLGRRIADFAAVTATVAAAGTAAVAYGAVVERNKFRLRHQTVPVLPPGFGPMRVLHLSDIHMSAGQRTKVAWLQSLADLKPDLVVNTGDNLSGASGIDPLFEALTPLLKFRGVYVPGSNDYFAPRFKNPAAYLFRPSRPRGHAPSSVLDSDRMFTAFGNSGWLGLTNRHQSLPLHGLRVDFAGVDDPHLGRDAYPGFPQGSTFQDDAPNIRLGLTHAPYQRVLNRFADDGADVIFAGHTHGGQICIPGFGAVVTNCDLPPWRARGLTEWQHNGHRSKLNVSAGIGTSTTAPVRFACPPEAVLLTLTSRE